MKSFAVAAMVGLALTAATHRTHSQPVANCTTGTPAWLAIQPGSTPVGDQASENLELLVQAFDAAGNPLANVPIVFEAPLSGPGANFVFIGPTAVFYAPQKQYVALNTMSTCLGAHLVFQRNGIVGTYQIAVSSGSASPLSIPVENPASLPLTIESNQARWWSGYYKRVAHGGKAYESWYARPVQNYAGVPSVPITYTIKPHGGSSASFPGGASSLTVLSADLPAYVGSAITPPLVADPTPGYFTIIASTPGAYPVELGPFVVAAGTVNTLSNPAAVPRTISLGQSVTVPNSVRFIGYPSRLYETDIAYTPLGFPAPGGSMVLVADGKSVAQAGCVSGGNPNGYGPCAPVCQTCDELTATWSLSTSQLRFGTHRLRVDYVSDGTYESSSSEEITVDVVPEFTGPTQASGVQSQVGITGNSTGGVSPLPGAHCALSDAEWVPLPADPPEGYTMPFGAFRYRIDGCAYDGKPTEPRISQQLGFMFDTQQAGSTTVFMGYGPTSDDRSPHWHFVSSHSEGDVLRVYLADGENGDDDMTINGTIAGLGAPAAPFTGPTSVPTLSARALALLAMLMMLAVWLGRRSKRIAKRPT